jgi:hypothetical protein
MKIFIPTLTPEIARQIADQIGFEDPYAAGKARDYVLHSFQDVSEIDADEIIGLIIAFYDGFRFADGYTYKTEQELIQDYNNCLAIRRRLN